LDSISTEILKLGIVKIVSTLDLTNGNSTGASSRHVRVKFQRQAMSSIPNKETWRRPNPACHPDDKATNSGSDKSSRLGEGKSK
jgi:hypothetical protein